MQPLVRLFSLLMRRPLRRFHTAIEDPAAAQLRRLRDILCANQDAAFGREHGFAQLQDFDAFRRAVPIRSYEAFTPWIERMKQGEPNILVSQPLELFATTSGTTAAPKFCPVTRRFTRECHRVHQLWMLHLARDHPGLLDHRLLSVVSPAAAGRTPGGVPYGSASGKQYLDQPLPVRLRHAVPYEVFGIPDYESRYHAILVFALQGPLSIATSVNPSTLVLLATRLQERAEALLDDLAAGRLAHAPALADRDRAPIERRLRPQPERARILRQRLRTDGVLLPRTVWPELTVLNTWQGGSAPFYLGQVEAAWGSVPRRCLGLRASEGTFSIPLQDNTPAGVLAVGGPVMEFLPADQDVTANARTLLAHELETGQRYRLLVTTSGGFYRYDLGDIVEVTGMRGRTPEVAFCHRAGSVLSITGEKVTEDQVVGVMHAAEKDFPGLAGFTVTLELVQPPRYVLAVEWAPRAPAADDRRNAALLGRFDQALAATNEEYEQKRTSGRLAAPRLALLEPGSYARRRAALVAEGRPDAQLKPPHLVRPAKPGPVPVAGGPFFDRVHVIRMVDLNAAGRSAPPSRS